MRGIETHRDLISDANSKIHEHRVIAAEDVNANISIGRVLKLDLSLIHI